MSSNSSDKSAKHETEATKTIKAAKSLESETGVHFEHAGNDDLNPELIDMISSRISHKTAKAAANMAETEFLESEIELEEKKDKMSKLKKRGEQPSSGFPASGMMGGFSGGGKALVLQTILNSMSPEKREKFIEENAAILLAENPSLSSLLGGVNKSEGNGKGGSDLAGVAMLMTAIAEARNQERLTDLHERKLRLSEEPSKPVVNDMGVKPTDLLDLIKVMNEKNTETIKSMNDTFTASMKVMQDQVQNIQNTFTKQSLDLQKSVIDAQKEVFETKQEHLMEKIEELSEARSNAPDGALTLKDLPLIVEQFGKIGMKVSNQNALDQETTRKYDLADRRLDIESKQWQKEKDIELASTNARAGAFSALTALVGNVARETKVDKALSNGGTQNAKSIASGRFNNGVD